MERGVDLLALALLMATLRDWLVICQKRMPRVCSLRWFSHCCFVWGGEGVKGGDGCTFKPGESMPAVTTRFEMTKQDMRKGRKTGWPVSDARQ